MAPKLFLVGTPIGNLDDMTFRAVSTLKSVSSIVAEDTRRARILCDKFGISARLYSMPAFSENDRAAGFVRKISESGEDWAMVSDAGMPGISDPGNVLVECAVEAGIEVIPIPGPSAATAALSASGLPTARFYFAGFLPRKGEHRRSLLAGLKRLSAVIVIYESPERLGSTLKELLEDWGDRRAVVCRELTKIHEEFARGTLSSLAQRFHERPKGEITLLVEGAAEEDSARPEFSPQVLAEEIRRRLLAGDASVKSITGELSELSGIKKSEVYAMVLKEKAALGPREDA